MGVEKLHRFAPALMLALTLGGIGGCKPQPQPKLDLRELPEQSEVYQEPMTTITGAFVSKLFTPGRKYKFLETGPTKYSFGIDANPGAPRELHLFTIRDCSQGVAVAATTCGIRKELAGLIGSGASITVEIPLKDAGGGEEAVVIGSDQIVQITDASGKNLLEEIPR